MDFSARLDPGTYADDEPVGLGVAEARLLPGPLPDECWAYIPESLWQRLLSLGHAYQLHFAQVTEPVIDTVLEPSQCESLCGELEFLASIVSDPAAQKAIAELHRCAGRVARKPSLRLIISPP